MMAAQNYYAKVLLVEDDFDLAGNILDHLLQGGFSVHHAPNSGIALNLLADEAYDAILLDVRLPGMSGLSLCEYLRRECGSDLPVLMITAADSLEDRLAGFRAGTDDYVVKPFALQEVEARLLALLRRCGRLLPGSHDLVSFGTLTLVPGQMLARRGERVLELTAMGFRILLELARNAPNIVPRRALESALWGDDPPGSDALRSHIFALRQALDRPPAKPMLRTIRGIGYQLVRD